MTSLPAVLYADLIGKPFRDAARGPDAYDCWGLLLAMLNRMGHRPTDFPSDPTLLAQALADEWQPIEPQNVQPGDGILLHAVDAYEWHVGLVLDSWHMLHTRAATGVCVQRFDIRPLRSRIAGFYRFRGRPE